ncbi:MAG: peptidylprolyl isomerase, partial [Clostridia bacterium]|nr:peptidylprolyl isomerase [Clostridia bacterium]
VTNMGKGNRSRQDRAFESVSTTTYETAPKNTKLITTIATAAVACILVACLALSAVVNTGVLLRSRNVAKTDNFSASGSIAAYLIYSQAQEMASLYQQYGLEYSVADILDMSFDSMSESTISSIKQMLVLCEYAEKNGIELSAEDEEAIDSYIDAIAEAASSNLYSTNAYIKLMYGNSVNVNDIREALEFNYRADAAYTVLKEQLETQITEEKINTYIDENIELFYMVDYLSYAFTAELTAEGAEASDEEKAAYEAKKTAYVELAAKLAECKSEDEFKAAVAEHIVNYTCSDLFDELYEKEALTDAPAADTVAADKANMLSLVLKSITTEENVKFEQSASEAYNNALSEIFDELCDEAETAYSNLLTEDKYHYDPESTSIGEVDTWLFDEATKVGDTKVITSEGDSKSTYTVYYLTKTSHLDESATKDVGHILVSFDDYKSGTTITDEEKAKAKAEAEKILADYLAGEQTKDAFEKLGEEKTADSNVFYEGVKKGDMVEAFENWLFDAARTVGETGIVETEYGYHVMYFVGEGKLAWENTAYDGVLGDIFKAWIDTEATACNYTENAAVLNSLK